MTFASSRWDTRLGDVWDRTLLVAFDISGIWGRTVGSGGYQRDLGVLFFFAIFCGGWRGFGGGRERGFFLTLFRSFAI